MIDPGDVFWLTAIGLGVAVAIVLLVWSWFQIRAWCWDGDDPAADAGAFLTSLRESAREGVVSDEEYRSIQSRLSSNITGSLSTSQQTRSSPTQSHGAGSEDDAAGSARSAATTSETQSMMDCDNLSSSEADHGGGSEHEGRSTG